MTVRCQECGEIEPAETCGGCGHVDTTECGCPCHERDDRGCICTCVAKGNVVLDGDEVTLQEADRILRARFARVEPATVADLIARLRATHLGDT